MLVLSPRLDPGYLTAYAHQDCVLDLTKISEKTALIHAGLEALIDLHARERLASLGGSDSKAKSGARRKAS